MRRLAPLLLAFLAGCSGTPAASDAETGGPEAEAAAGTPSPVWEAGMWWNFTSPQSGSFALVVAADHGADWDVATDHSGVVFFDALGDISYMGPQRKSDLAGSQGSARVEYFRWPLTDGANWTTEWDGIPVQVSAGAVGNGTYHMVARNGTAPYAAYTYDAAVGWFRDMAFFGPDGAVQFEMRLQAHGTGYTGTVARWSLDEAVAKAGGLDALPAQGSFSVPADATDVFVQWDVDCASGAAGISAAPGPSPSDRGVSTFAPCPYGSAGSEAFANVAPAQGGEESWGWTVTSNPASAGSYSLRILVRTLERAAV